MHACATIKHIAIAWNICAMHLYAAYVRGIMHHLPTVRARVARVRLLIS
jgi:hypothetical protein